MSILAKQEVLLLADMMNRQSEILRLVAEEDITVADAMRLCHETARMATRVADNILAITTSKKVEVF